MLLLLSAIELARSLDAAAAGSDEFRTVRTDDVRDAAVALRKLALIVAGADADLRGDADAAAALTLRLIGVPHQSSLLVISM